MRVSNRTILTASVNRLQDNLQALEKSRHQISSGKRVNTMSDDPSAGTELVRLGSSFRAIEQYRRNINFGKARATTEESTLDELMKTMDRAVELSVAQSSGTANAQTRSITKSEVDVLINQAVALGNTRFGDDYLFGGTRAGEAPLRVPPNPGDPFTALVDGSNTPVDPSGNLDVEIGDGRYVTPNHNATQVFLDTGVLDALRSLSTALGNNDQAAIGASTQTLMTASSHVQDLLGEQGARARELLESDDRLDSLALTMEQHRSDLRDTEIEKTMIELVGRQTQYQAAMSATARVLGLSLANYL